MFQIQDICKSKESLWVYSFLVMVINNQEDMSVILTNPISSIELSCSERIFIFSPCPQQGGKTSMIDRQASSFESLSFEQQQESVIGL
jgi:hypothetical protein